jgi:hypothetical protein
MRIILFLFFAGLSSFVVAQHRSAVPAASPRIVNIVNFIRLLEPRDPAITEDVLYQTVVKQVVLMRQYHLRGTFLLQYDALMDGRYQSLLRSLPRDSFEIGAWWELPQPLIEKAGLKWRGRYPWDWHANVGFVTGYTPAERERLIDVYMADFKRIFGYYPASVGSWFIDAHSLQYMYDRYHIVASCNCKDQYGTDGYTLWGGYWNQAYYPSRTNSYMPAQHESAQIPVPVFRMLGSDPIRQYDNGLGGSRQGVVTLEPVYKFGGGDSAWVDWFFGAFTSSPDLGFNYTQAGQENSFTWDAMSKGLGIQFPLLARLRDQHKVRVETLATSGRWFREKYPVTPATTFSVGHDVAGSDKRTIWYDSRFYRTNILWEGGRLRIRDIHLFDERFPSVYESAAVDSTDCRFFTLPFVDGYVWSKPGRLAGLRLKAMVDGKAVELEGGDPSFVPMGPSRMRVDWPVKTMPGHFAIDLEEKTLSVQWVGKTKLDWFFELDVAEGADLPFGRMDDSTIDCHFEGMKYGVNATIGSFSKVHLPAVFTIQPTGGRIALNFGGQEPTQAHLFGEGVISTGDYETHPAFSPGGDTLYFLKGLPDANFFSICVSFRKNGKWTAPEVAPFSGRYLDADPFVTKDGKTLYFVSNRPVVEGGAVKPDWDIWKVDIGRKGWGVPVHLDSPINSSSSEYFPTMADNGNLYFGSGRKGGKGRSDLYVCRWVNGSYSAPENLGDSVNTADNEYEPFISPDEQFLVFMATYPNGLGNADFYISQRVNGVWSKAKRLPEPINSDATEWGGKMTRDGRFFFGSSRNKITDNLPRREDMKDLNLRLHSAGNGLGDIYFVDWKEVKF